MSPTLRRGLSDEIGSWKIICIWGRIRRRSLPCRSVSSTSLEADAARRGRRELHDRPPGRRLPAAGLADEPERLAREQVEADPRHRVHALAAPGGELHDEVLDAEQRVVALPEVRGAGARHQAASPDVARLRSSAAAPSGVPTGNQQRYWWPGVGPSNSGGCSSRHLSCTYAQRSANRQPGGGETRSGGRPGIAVRRGVARLGDLRDRAQERFGVGHAHVVEQRRRRRRLHDLSRVHHDHVVGAAGDDAEIVGDEHHRHEALALLRFEHVEHLRLHGDVERRRRLVGEQQLRAGRERDRDAHALAQAAGELVRVVAHAPFGVGDADRREE